MYQNLLAPHALESAYQEDFSDEVIFEVAESLSSLAALQNKKSKKKKSSTSCGTQWSSCQSEMAPTRGRFSGYFGRWWLENLFCCLIWWCKKYHRSLWTSFHFYSGKMWHREDLLDLQSRREHCSEEKIILQVRLFNTLAKKIKRRDVWMRGAPPVGT